MNFAAAYSSKSHPVSRTVFLRTVSIFSAVACGLFPCESKSGNQQVYSSRHGTVSPGCAIASSATYSSVASFTDLAAVGTSAGISNRVGFAASLYQLQALRPELSLPIFEGTTHTLAWAADLDDGSKLELPPNDVLWSASGPLRMGQDATQLLADAVYEDTPGSLDAAYGLLHSTLPITVLNSDRDNFGSYARDGLPDDWQVSHFGIDNPLAAPNVDVLGTGESNWFKYVAGLDPNDPNARFKVDVLPFTSGDSERQIRFSPAVAGRSYQLLTNDTLTDGSQWREITPTLVESDTLGRTIMHVASPGPTGFFRVVISIP